MTDTKLVSLSKLEAVASEIRNALNTHTHTVNDITDLSLNDGKLEIDMSDLYKKNEVDGLLSNKADKSDTYTKEEIDAKISEAMNEMVRKQSANSQEVN